MKLAIVPEINPISEPSATFMDCDLFLFSKIAPAKAPKKGPKINPSGATNSPKIVPKTNPKTDILPPPNFLTPNIEKCNR